MRIAVDHRTTYRFTEPQSRLVQMLRLTPADTYDQTVARWRIDVSCDARLHEGQDGFGNRVTMLYAEGPLDALEIAVTGEVLTSHSDGVVRGAPEPLPPAVFLRVTQATTPDPSLAIFAREAGGRDPLDRMHRLNAALHERFGCERSRPEPGLNASEAFERERATPRDLAHIFCACARTLGIPARYVTGYHLGEKHRPTPHGWAEAHVQDLGWVGFDPCVGLSPEEDYVRVAVGLDASSASPIAGSRLGDGEEQLAVDVNVTGAG